uniref:Uncharacterized protein n=1 Tax=Anguilla anguilla TaxID=7936 RepID=A0A0E9Q912_ANGAN
MPRSDQYSVNSSICQSFGGLDPGAE